MVLKQIKNIHKEYLCSTFKNQDRKTCFERNSKTITINDDAVAGTHDLKDAWKKATRNNALFLSTAAQLNSEEMSLVIEWFQEKLRIFSKTSFKHTVDKIKKSKKIKINLKYQINGDDYYLPLQEESDGTRNIFNFAGIILDILDNGRIWIADELHNNLHPKALEALIKLRHLTI